VVPRLTAGPVLLETAADDARRLRPVTPVQHGEGYVLRSEPDAPAPGIRSRASVASDHEILRHGGVRARNPDLWSGALDHPAARNLVEIRRDDASAFPALSWRMQPRSG
jgi:hypothetical protein